MHALEENIDSKVRIKVDIVIITVESRFRDAVLTAIENLVIPRVEVAMKSANASSGRSVDCNVLEPDQRDFSGNAEALQMNASSSINSRTHLKKIDETRGKFTVGESDLLVNKRIIDRQTHTYHSTYQRNLIASVALYSEFEDKKSNSESSQFQLAKKCNKTLALSEWFSFRFMNMGGK